jgi:hypothetical protein
VNIHARLKSVKEVKEMKEVRPSPQTLSPGADGYAVTIRPISHETIMRQSRIAFLSAIALGPCSTNMMKNAPLPVVHLAGVRVQHFSLEGTISLSM